MPGGDKIMETEVLSCNERYRAHGQDRTGPLWGVNSTCSTSFNALFGSEGGRDGKIVCGSITDTGEGN